MTRALTILAAFVAVVAGVGSGIVWLNEQVTNTESLSFAGGVLSVVLASAWLLAYYWGERFGLPSKRRYLAYMCATFIFGWFDLLVLDEIVSDYVDAYLLVSVALIPWAIETSIVVRASRTRCPDCREDIRADANVCKHCGFRIRPKPKIVS